MELQSFILQMVRKSGGEISGRVRLQKLIYFCKALGADINVNYKLYIYGPFSQQVADALQDCVVEDALYEVNGAIRKGIEFETNLKPLTDQSEQIMEDVIKLCESLTTRELEITATTFFINRQQEVLFGVCDKDAIIEKVTRAKGNRFDADEIARSYQRVIESCFPLVKKYAMAI